MSKKSRTGILDQPLSVGLLSAGALAISPGSFLEVQAKLEEAHLTEGAIADLQGPGHAPPFFHGAPCRVQCPVYLPPLGTLNKPEMFQ
jgi:hypothetical protein